MLLHPSIKLGQNRTARFTIGAGEHEANRLAFLAERLQRPCLASQGGQREFGRSRTNGPSHPHLQDLLQLGAVFLPLGNHFLNVGFFLAAVPSKIEIRFALGALLGRWFVPQRPKGQEGHHTSSDDEKLALVLTGRRQMRPQRWTHLPWSSENQPARQRYEDSIANQSLPTHGSRVQLAEAM